MTTKPKIIRPPLNDDIIRSLKAGDEVLITGMIYTARDMAHKRLCEAIDKGMALPFEIKGAIIYFCGPTPAPPGRPIGSAGPTTSSRMDPFSPKLIAAGLKAMLGKGYRNQAVRDALKQHCAVHLSTIGGSGALLAKHITAAVSRYRQVLPGRDYLPPPTSGKINPLEIAQAEFKRLWDVAFDQLQPVEAEINKFLVTTFSGFGPFLAEEALARSADTSVENVWQALSEIAAIIRSGAYEPVMITRNNGSIELVYPIPSFQYPSERQHRRTSILEILDSLFRQDVSKSEIEDERSKLETVIRRAIGSREQTLKSLHKSISEGKDADKYKILGNLILSNLQNIEKGQSEARVIDYYDPETSEIVIPLDPQLSPKENAEHYFRKFQKVRDGAEAAKDRISEIQKEVLLLTKELDDLPTLTDVERVRELRKTLVGRGLLRKESVAPTGKRQEPEFGGARIRKTTSSDGWEILYGENSESNDYLTTRIAAPDDIWLHARSITGAHVVIRTNKRPQAVPPGTLHQAAEIAAANSQAKHSSLIPVDYTLRKYVRKPRGTPPGFVTYVGEKTLDVSYPNLTCDRSQPR